ncbi:MAG: carbonic anhydrase [Gemmatales bacterium]
MKHAMFNRRQWLLSASATLAASSLSEGASPSLQVASELPEQALKRLIDGNARFVAGKSEAPHRNLERLKEIAPRQAPYAAFLGCADSRVPIEIIFDQGFGDLFVTRIAGNVVTPECIGSLEFATLLGVKVVYVLGHTSCGAVQAAAEGKEVPGQISVLFQHIRPAVKAATGDMSKAIQENVRLQAGLLAESSTVLSRLIKEKKLIIAGGVYDLKTGIVEPVKL